MKLSDNEIGNIVEQEEKAALDYEGELSQKRAKNLDYYNMRPYGDEVPGQSSAITSDVSDVIEWMLPSLIRIFTQGKLIARFEATREENEQEARDKTFLSNYTFMHDNNGTLILHNMFKDALLQYTGTVKVCYEEEEQTTIKRYEGMSEIEFQLLSNEDGVSIEEVEMYDSEFGTLYDVELARVTNHGCIKYYNIPPEEFLISKSARDFERPIFIGHRSPKRRSELIEMGFDREVVDMLPADEYWEASEQKNARYNNYDNWQDINPANHHPNDIVYLGEYYCQIDVNGDGITELWKVFYAGRKVLEKEQVDSHPFAVCVPVPIPHRAIGTCPAEQVAPIQFRKSILVRQLLDNVYQSNYPRILHSNKVDLDDLATPRSGGLIEVDSDLADVQGHAVPLVIPNMIEGVMSAIEYTDMEREIRTGITRYSQGLDAESLNKTATGFKGIMDASQQRLDLIARLFADGGVKQIFVKTVELLGKYQDTKKQIKILGKPVEINPKDWSENINCRIDVGIGSGDRQEKIVNLNNILMLQQQFIQQGMVLSDQAKIFNTLEKLIDEVGLKDADEYFNNPETPEEILQAQLEQAQVMIQQLQQQISMNPLADAEKIRAQASLVKAQSVENIEVAKIQQKSADDQQKREWDKQKFMAEEARKRTELELKYNDPNIPGAIK